VKEVAARLRVCTATVYRLCTAGRLALPASARASGSGRRTWGPSVANRSQRYAQQEPGQGQV